MRDYLNEVWLTVVTMLFMAISGGGAFLSGVGIHGIVTGGSIILSCLFIPVGILLIALGIFLLQER